MDSCTPLSLWEMGLTQEQENQENPSDPDYSDDPTGAGPGDGGDRIPEGD